MATGWTSLRSTLLGVARTARRPLYRTWTPTHAAVDHLPLVAHVATRITQAVATREQPCPPLSLVQFESARAQEAIAAGIGNIVVSAWELGPSRHGEIVSQECVRALRVHAAPCPRLSSSVATLASSRSRSTWRAQAARRGCHVCTLLARSVANPGLTCLGDGSSPSDSPPCAFAPVRGGRWRCLAPRSRMRSLATLRCASSHCWQRSQRLRERRHA